MRSSTTPNATERDTLTSPPKLATSGEKNHTCAYTQAGKCHFRAHGHSHFASLEPFHNTTTYCDTGHFYDHSQKIIKPMALNLAEAGIPS